MKFTPQAPVAWFSPSVLANAAAKVALSSIFGSYADKREGFRTENAAFYDYSNGSDNLNIVSLSKTPLTTGESMEFMRNAADSPIDASRDISEQKTPITEVGDMWIDFVSDLGDGFNATYTMAHLLAQPELEVYAEKLPRGKVLIMGGDEVYPTADILEYRNRMLGPYNAAFPFEFEGENRPHLYAVPGNHDWYDGLTNFVKIFCQKRFVGNWETYQQYSYFAIKLPHNVWIWAIDVQLVSEIDLGQMEYFRRVIKYAEQNGGFAGSNVILCTAEPAWVRRATQAEDFAYEKLKTFEEKVIRAYGGKLAAVLTGDLHHYSHYECKDEGVQPPVFHRITAGGGGAFLHPTHGLPQNYDLKYVEKKDGKDAEGKSKREVRERHETAELKATFPTQSDSKSLIWKNLRFAFINKGLSLTLAILFLVLGIFMNTAGIKTVGDMFGNATEKIPFPVAAWVLGAVLVFGLGQFTDILRNKWFKTAGIIHGMGHLIGFAFTYQLLKGLSIWDETCCPNALFLASLTAVMFVVSGTWFGIYLIITNLVLGIHENEGFSSFMHEGYKNFLRIHVTQDTLTIYPIGVREEVKDWKVNYDKSADRMVVSGSKPKIEMIENEPIVIQLVHADERR